MMASTKDDIFDEEKPQAKRARTDSYVLAFPVKPVQRVALNSADCDLDFNIDSVGLVGSALYEQGFAYCWSGARANVGITRGKYCFGCTVISEQPVDMEDTARDQQHVCRLGISRGDIMVGNLGESEHSFGYGGTGKFSNGGKFSDYGHKFGIGDTVVCCIDLENKPLASIDFYKNGEWLGTATQFDAGSLGLGGVGSPFKDLRWKSAFFPHILLKNVVVRMQFSLEDGLIPKEGFKPWASAIEDQNFIVGPTCCDRRDCELIMMVGLPGSGKTTWAEKWVKGHPEKRYVLLGINLILDQMKVPGLFRKNNYREQFDRLMDRASGIFNVLISRAANTLRNYIIDQTNVSKSARKCKLKPFADFHKTAVVTFPKPEDLKRRYEKRVKETGKELPPYAANSMLAIFVLPKSKYTPGSDEYFDEVMYVELSPEESSKYLKQMKQFSALSNNYSLMRGNVEPYSEVGGGSYGGAYVEGNNNVLPGAFPDPYRSGMNHPCQGANTRTVPSSYNVHGGPYRDIGGPQYNLLSSGTPTASNTPLTSYYDSHTPYNGTTSSRPPLGNFPDNMRLSFSIHDTIDRHMDVCGEFDSSNQCCKGIKSCFPAF